MRLAFNLSTGADTGGAAIREVEAFRSLPGRSSGWAVRAMVAATNYIGYPQDMRYSLRILHDTYDAADVVHLNHTLHGHIWYDQGQGKPIVLEHHGLHHGSFDVDLAGAIRMGSEIGAVQIGSTVNLELFGPIEWAPIPYDLTAMRRLRRAPAGGSRPIRVGHAPTNRLIKSTDAFIAALEQLRGEGLAVEPVLIEGVSHAACLARKASCDVFVDQLNLGYGCNAIEAWAMGIPVVGGVADAEWRSHMVDRYALPESETGLPFVSATEETLADVLRDLVLDADLRSHWAGVGVQHVENWHSQSGSVAQMTRIYGSAGATTPGAASVAVRRRK